MSGDYSTLRFVLCDEAFYLLGFGAFLSHKIILFDLIFPLLSDFLQSSFFFLKLFIVVIFDTSSFFIEDTVGSDLKRSALRILIEDNGIIFSRIHLLHLFLFYELDLLLLLPFVQLTLFSYEGSLQFVLERVKKIVIEVSVSVTLCLFNYFPLDCWHWSLVEVVATTGSFRPKIHRERFLSDWFRLQESCIGTGLTDKVVFNRKRK